MSYKNVKYGRKNFRRNYARVQTNVELPNLIEVQTKSFEWLLNDGLKKLFQEVSPILDHSDGERFELSLLDHYFEPPVQTIQEAKIHDSNYSRKLKCKVLLENKETGEIKEDEVFMGDIPVMTPTGTFVIHGSEKVIVTQIVRSAGVFFSSEKDKKTGEYFYSGQIIPTRGFWIEFEIGGKDKKHVWYAKVDRTKKIPLTAFIRALGLGEPSEIKDLFFGKPVMNKKGEIAYDFPKNLYDTFANTIEKDPTFGVDEGIKAFYECIRPGDRTTPDAARKYIQSHFFDSRRYDLAEVGRYKVNEKLDIIKRASERNYRLAYDLVDPENNKTILFAGDEISKNAIVKRNGEEVTLDTISILREHRHLLEKEINFDVVLDTEKIIVETLDVIAKTAEGEVVVRLIGNNQKEEATHIVLSDIFATISYFLNLQVGIGKTDDIDHLGNRRLRLIGELLQNKFRVGLLKLEKSIKDKMSISNDTKSLDPKYLMNNCRVFYAPVLEFFSTDQLSQFMDQINPLAELTHKRRLSALGQGGISRDRATIEVRDVHPSHYGRICPVETPEGQNIGLINSLATYSRANRFGFIETPYIKVYNNKHDPDYIAGKVPLRVWTTNNPEDIEYMNAYDEEKYFIAEANVKMKTDEATGDILITDDVVMARHNLEFQEVTADLLDYVDVSPKQVVACGTACIPFLEHDDTTRALMGANMQRQAIPLLRPEAPIVGTGIEAKVAHDSGVAVVSDIDGVVKYVDGLKVIVTDNSGNDHEFILNKYERSNSSTCANQRPIVVPGEQIKVGDVLADGQSMEQGELALGRNVVIAFMTWNGYNFEDAVIMSERMVQDDVYTSIHIESYDCLARDTKLGKEVITNELEGESADSKAFLDENGIVIPGSEVKEGDTLVGKLTPKGVSEPTGAEKLTLALLGDNSKDVRVTSLKVPHGGEGIVCKVEHFKRDANTILPAGVNEQVRVFIVQKRKISEGDKMSGRHGNKGVISNIVPIEDMPYMSDGTPVDIMLNPQGVPSRMNIGQVLEVHLGMAAKKLGVKVATPVFDGVTKDDLIEIMNEAREKDLETMKNDPRSAGAIIDENGKTYLYDGRTGRQFDHKICVGVMYMIKLAHMVDDKLHARSGEGPYTLVTQQPMGGKAQNGGQRFGEMEVWALEAYGAAHTLQEMMTIKSDDIIGRNKVYKAIVDGEPIPEAGVPEAFRTMIKELQGLGLSVRLIDQNDHDVANDSIVDDIIEAQTNKLGL